MCVCHMLSKDANRREIFLPPFLVKKKCVCRHITLQPLLYIQYMFNQGGGEGLLNNNIHRVKISGRIELWETFKGHVTDAGKDTKLG